MSRAALLPTLPAPTPLTLLTKCTEQEPHSSASVQRQSSPSHPRLTTSVESRWLRLRRGLRLRLRLVVWQRANVSQLVR